MGRAKHHVGGKSAQSCRVGGKEKTSGRSPKKPARGVGTGVRKINQRSRKKNLLQKNLLVGMDDHPEVPKKTAISKETLQWGMHDHPEVQKKPAAESA